MDGITVSKKIPRRTFLRFFLGAAALGYAGYSIGAAQEFRSKKKHLKLNGPLSFSVFSALIGDNFTLMLADPKSRYHTRLQLMEANTVSLTQFTDQFDLVFRVLDENLKPDGVYWIKHPKAGKTKLFLQSMSQDKPENYCMASFNLLL